MPENMTSKDQPMVVKTKCMTFSEVECLGCRGAPPPPMLGYQRCCSKVVYPWSLYSLWLTKWIGGFLVIHWDKRAENRQRGRRAMGNISLEPSGFDYFCHIYWELLRPQNTGRNNYSLASTAAKIVPSGTSIPTAITQGLLNFLAC